MSAGRDKRYLAEYVLELEQERTRANERAAKAEAEVKLLKERAVQLADKVIELRRRLAAKE